MEKYTVLAVAAIIISRMKVSRKHSSAPHDCPDSRRLPCRGWVGVCIVAGLSKGHRTSSIGCKNYVPQRRARKSKAQSADCVINPYHPTTVNESRLTLQTFVCLTYTIISCHERSALAARCSTHHLFRHDHFPEVLSVTTAS